MQRNFFTSLSLATAILASSSMAHASNDNLYVSAFGGYSKSMSAKSGSTYDTKLGNGGVFGAGIGTKLEGDMRADISLSHRTGFNFSTSATTGAIVITESQDDIAVTAMMVSVYKDFEVGNGFKPYLTGGVGMARVSGSNYKERIVVGGLPLSDMSKSGKSSNNFAWQVGAGVSYAFDKTMDFDLGYRYADFGKIKAVHPNTGKNLTGRVKSHEFLAGLRIGL